MPCVDRAAGGPDRTSDAAGATGGPPRRANVPERGRFTGTAPAEGRGPAVAVRPLRRRAASGGRHRRPRLRRRGGASARPRRCRGGSAPPAACTVRPRAAPPPRGRRAHPDQLVEPAPGRERQHPLGGDGLRLGRRRRGGQRAGGGPRADQHRHDVQRRPAAGGGGGAELLDRVRRGRIDGDPAARAAAAGDGASLRPGPRRSGTDPVVWAAARRGIAWPSSFRAPRSLPGAQRWPGAFRCAGGRLASGYRPHSGVTTARASPCGPDGRTPGLRPRRPVHHAVVNQGRDTDVIAVGWR
jgi:hypothetical protein